MRAFYFYCTCTLNCYREICQWNTDISNKLAESKDQNCPPQKNSKWKVQHRCCFRSVQIEGKEKKEGKKRNLQMPSNALCCHKHFGGFGLVCMSSVEQDSMFTERLGQRKIKREKERKREREKSREKTDVTLCRLTTSISSLDTTRKTLLVEKKMDR